MSRVNPKLLYALGAVVVAVLAYLFVVTPLLLGNDDAVPLPVPSAADREAAVESSDEEPAAGTVPESMEVFSARDPFQQLVTAEGGSPGAGSTPVPVEAPRLVDEVTVRLTQVVVDEAGTPRAQLTVDGVEHQPAEGEAFAEHLRLLDIADQCVTVQVGDQRVALCAGEEIRA